MLSGEIPRPKIDLTSAAFCTDSARLTWFGQQRFALASRISSATKGACRSGEIKAPRYKLGVPRRALGMRPNPRPTPAAMVVSLELGMVGGIDE
jgi:hypothetical protein